MILKSAASVAVAPPADHRPQTQSTIATAAPRVPRRVPIVELSEHLTCCLCKGYFIDATTIIECLHSFCRSCIVKYLESNKYCPVCDVQVHKTKPLLNIRPDKILQDIVYKLVPRLFQNEMQKRHEYYAQHTEARPSAQETRTEATYQHLLTPDEMLCISLMYNGAADKCQPRFLRCSVAVSIGHLQKLIRNKYDLSAHHRVEILHQEDTLAAYLTLMDVAYIYLWRRKGPLALTYRIYENVKKTHPTSIDSSAENNNNDSSGEEGWKEVQLRISENGEMSVTGIQDCLSLLDANILQDDKDKDKANEGKKEVKETAAKKVKLERKTAANAKESSKKDPKRETRSALQVKNAATDVNTNSEKTKMKMESQQSGRIPKDRKRKSTETTEDKLKSGEKEVDSKKSKLNELQSTLPACISITTKPVAMASTPVGLQNLSNNHPLKKHSLTMTKSTPSVSVSLSSATTVSPSTYAHSSPGGPPGAPGGPPGGLGVPPGGLGVPGTINKLRNDAHCWTTSRNVTVTPSTLKVSTVSSSSSVKSTAATTSSTYTSSSAGKQHYSRVYTPPSANYTPINVPSLPSIPSVPNLQRMYMPPGQHHQQSQQAHRGKDLRSQPPQTPRPQTPPPTQVNDLRNVRPAKFFKMRNNMPRYLGCPASGVKPIYAVHDSPEKDEAPDREPKEKEKKPPAKSIKDLARNLRDSKDPKEKLDKKAPGASTSALPPGNSEKKASTTEIKRHSIVKIDPKTLKPITERAPELTSLTTSNYSKATPSPAADAPGPGQQDLKINTSSVSIFNPIKLQAERKSPHSPISKRPASSPTQNHTAHSPGPGQTQGQSLAQGQTQGLGLPMGMHPMHQKHPHPHPKPNLSYTPPNPFVPNLQAPTMSPNQFMYPSPAGFPYDPMMAAFLAYTRAPFNYDFHKMQMGQMGFGVTVQPMTPGSAGGMMMTTPQAPGQQAPASTSTSTPKKAKLDAKEGKERSRETKSSPKTLAKEVTGKTSPKTPITPPNSKPAKSEKSLQNALDKLTKAKMSSESTEHVQIVNSGEKPKQKIEIKSNITIAAPTSQVTQVTQVTQVSHVENKSYNTEYTPKKTDVQSIKSSAVEPIGSHKMDNRDTDIGTTIKTATMITEANTSVSLKEEVSKSKASDDKIKPTSKDSSSTSSTANTDDDVVQPVSSPAAIKAIKATKVDNPRNPRSNTTEQAPSDVKTETTETTKTTKTTETSQSSQKEHKTEEKEREQEKECEVNVTTNTMEKTLVNVSETAVAVAVEDATDVPLLVPAMVTVTAANSPETNVTTDEKAPTEEIKDNVQVQQLNAEAVINTNKAENNATDQTETSGTTATFQTFEKLK